jgi:iron complex transport system substrate-binding protein
MKLTTRILCALLALSLLLAGCGSTTASSVSESSAADEAAAAETVTFTDDMGREVTAPANPERVVAMIGSFADIWCLAGGRDTLVATANDAWTSFDLGLGDDVANLGAIKEPNLELLLASEPDFILASCNTTANVDLLETFENAGIPVAYFDIQNFEDYANMMQICTTLTGNEENYQTNCADVREQVEAAIARKDDSAPTVLCIRATGSSCKVKGSVDNVLGEMLADLGCVNIADSDSALLEDLSIEAIIAGDPDYIFVVLQGSDPTDAQKTLDETLLSNPAWSNLRAVQEGRYYVVENELYNLKPNARWGEAYEKLADILYPEEG